LCEGKAGLLTKVRSLVDSEPHTILKGRDYEVLARNQEPHEPFAWYTILNEVRVPIRVPARLVEELPPELKE
jgi:hypothetical protein